MCLAVPGKILEISDDRMAVVDFIGTSKKVSVELLPDAKVGDYCIVHAGFAISKAGEEEFRETIKHFEELYRLSR